MNKRYTLILASAVAGTCMAQTANNIPARLMKAEPREARTASGTSDALRGNTVFSEDFANGMTGNNGIGEWTPTGVNAAMWRWSPTGPVGAFSVPTQIIASATVSNGFMMFNGDSANTNFLVDPPVIVANPIE